MTPRQTQMVSLNKLKLDHENARCHDAESIEGIKQALLVFGQVTPIVATRNGVIRKGNGTYMAAQALGWKRIEVRYVSMSEDRARVYSVADNRTSDMSSFDGEKVQMVRSRMIERDAFRPLSAALWAGPDLAAVASAPEITPAPRRLKETPPRSTGGVTGQPAGWTGPKPGMKSLVMTVDQYQIVLEAIEKLRESESDASIANGRALELICADYLAS